MDLLIFQVPILMVQASLDGILLGILFALIASLGASIMIVTNQSMSKRQINPIQINIFINFFNAIFFFIILSLFYEIDFNINDHIDINNNLIM